MFSQIRRINVNKMASSIRKMSDNKDIKYDMIISELQNINTKIDIAMMWVIPAAGFYIGTNIGTILVASITLLK
jgi:hypothetical protein